jgi:CheY-like chemotaxis protein
MDINLPGISGIDAMNILRKDPETARIPIIALSAPPRQNSCRPDMILNLGAIRMKDGTVRRSIQEQGGGEVVAAGERQCGLGGERDWSVGADIGTVA